jgi:hypothetical protein
VCSICLKSKSVKQLLIDSLAVQRLSATGKTVCLCPVCDFPMAPNMKLAVIKFQEEAIETEPNYESDMIEKPNPFALYYQKIELQIDTHIFDTQTESRIVAQKCCNLLHGLDDFVFNRLSSVGVLEFIAEIYCLVGINIIS